jgi:hypothetical protein
MQARASEMLARRHDHLEPATTLSIHYNRLKSQLCQIALTEEAG